MKQLILCVLLLGITHAALAEQVTCALSQIVNGAPTNWENKTVSKDIPTDLKTTDGLFTGKVVYQEGQQGYSMILKYRDTAAGGFFDGSPNSPVLSLFVDGKHAQINCFVDSE